MTVVFRGVPLGCSNGEASPMTFIALVLRQYTVHRRHTFL